MAHIETVAKPRGASERYQFFKNMETGNSWKAAIVIQRVASPVGAVGFGVEVAPTTLAMTITVSPTKADGKALRDKEDRPIVIESWTHTFTEVEMASPSFDPQARIMAVIAERVELGETKIAGNKKIEAFASRWEGKNKLKMKPVRFSPPKPEKEPDQ